MIDMTNYIPLIVYRDLITLTDSVDGGVFLSYLAHCSQQANHDWFIRTREHCWFDTGIKKDRQITLCKQLLQSGLIETKITGLPARTHYHVAVHTVKQKMAAHQNNGRLDTPSQKTEQCYA